MASELKKAIFLDRDGVINRERGDFTWKMEDFQLNEGLSEALIHFRRLGFLLIVISNQSGIGRGIYSKEDADHLHAHLRDVLLNQGVTLEEIYYCPHHPSTSSCICRKPEALLLEKAMARFQIDPNQSWFIGDAERDMEAARKAGVKPLQMPANASLLTVLPLISESESS